MIWFKNTKTGCIWKTENDSRQAKELERNPDFQRLSKKQLAEEKQRMQNLIEQIEEDEEEVEEGKE